MWNRTDTYSGIFPDACTFLYNFIIKHKCLKVLEIGMADGMASVTILSAISKNGPEFKLTSIDPYQNAHWQSNGLKNVKQLKLESNHEFIELIDFLALPKLIERGEKYDLIFIDGQHTFDHVLLNNFYADHLLKIGGFIINDDIWLPSIKNVCAFLTNNYNHFEIIEDSYPRFGPIYKKISNKVIIWDQFTTFAL